MKKLLILACLLIVNCSVTTTYGVAPKQNTRNPDIYSFTLYYNAFTNEQDLIAKIESTINDFMLNSKQSQKRYYSYKYLDYKNYSNNKIVYNVQFYNEVGKTDKRNSPSLKNMPSYIAKEQSLQNQLKGKHYSEVIERLGAYLRTVEDGKGGTIYIWETYNEAQTYDNINPLYGRTVLGVKQETFLYQTHTQSASSSMQVMCNSDGIIYKVIYKEQGYE